LNRTVMHPNDQLTVSVLVTNTGNFDGTETVQLYLRQMTASITQPVKELKGFQQIFLKKGASKMVIFHLGIDDLKFFDQQMHWTYEPSEMKVMVGGNSRDVEQAGFRLER
ncbi:MAG: fibronectin type III-like domain-contianing protein, partial [Chitinophagaceae bacterium]